MLWRVVNRGNYLELQFKRRRVCDFFPFARGESEHLIRQQADLIAATMNEAEELRIIAADSAISAEAIGLRIRNTYRE